jgi:hypothetical protein
MAFQVINYQASRPEQQSPFGNLLSGALKSYSAQQKAKYLPQELQADIIGKSVAPLAQIASSPLASAMIKQQKQQMLKYISQVMQGAQGGQPQQEQAGVFDNVPVLGNLSKMISHYVSNRPDLHQPEEGSQESGNSSNQNSNQMEVGFANKAVAPAFENPHAPGTVLLNDNNQPSSVTATAEQIAHAQKTLSAIQQANPALKKIYELAKPFSNDLEGYAKRISSKLSSKNPGLSNQWNQLVGQQNILKSQFQKLGMSEEDAAQEVKFKKNENADVYINRLKNDMSTYREQGNVAAKQTAKGFDLGQKNEVPGNALPKESGTLMVDSEGNEKYVPDDKVDFYIKKGASIKNIGNE